MVKLILTQLTGPNNAVLIFVILFAYTLLNILCSLGKSG